MHHKTTLKKGLRRVRIDGEADVGTEITLGDKRSGRCVHPSGWRSIGLSSVRSDGAGHESGGRDPRTRRLTALTL